MSGSKKILSLVIVALGILIGANLYADVGPAANEPSANPSSKAIPEQAQPAAPTNTAVQAETPQDQQAASNVQGQPNAKAASYNFPKVATKEDENLARKFEWWPTDAKPGPYKDREKSGYWWWPDVPGQARPWGNQGFVYVRKVIFDYKTTEGPMKPSLIIKRILKNVKIYFDFDKADMRDDARAILDQALYTLEKNPKADILITGNADTRGSEQYNMKLGERRADVVQHYLSENGLTKERIRILSRGKLDAVAKVRDLVGMQKDRNAQFMIAEVEEVMIPADKAQFFQDKVIEEKQQVESEVKVGTKDYVIAKGDTLWKIAKQEYGDGKQWKRIYEFNKEVIANPDRPRKGTKIKIPIE